MAQPPAYTRQYDFSDYQDDFPDAPLPGNQVDIEFNAVRTSLNAAINNIGLIQSDDGSLRNASVAPETFDTDALALITSGLNFRGAWVTATAYAIGDVIRSTSGATYVCIVAHTSGTFATDLAADKWALFANPVGALGDIVFQKHDGDGVTTAFSLPIPVQDEKQLFVFVGGEVQDPSAAYTVSGSTITFTVAPPNATGNILIFGVDQTAVQSANEAASSAAEAEGFRDEAEGFKDDAETAATSATADAATATTQAGIATTKASEASASAAAALASELAVAAAVASGMFDNTQDKSGNYTVVAGDEGDLIRVDTSGGNVVITLTEISTLGDFKIAIAKITGDVNTVTIQGSSGDTINGAASYVLDAQYENVTLISETGSTDWFAIGGGASVSGFTAPDYFTGDGVDTTFTLSSDPGTENAIAVTVGGVPQLLNTFSVSGTTLTFSEAPANGAAIEVRYLAGVALDIGVTSDGSVTTAKLASSVASGLTNVTAQTTDHIVIADSSDGGAVKKTLVSSVKDAIVTTANQLQVVAAGTVYSLTTSEDPVVFGTTSPALVITAPGTYLLTYTAHVMLNGATFGTARVPRVLLKRTNNTPADITDSLSALRTGTPTTATQTLGYLTISVIYTTANSNDNIAMYANINALPSAGTVDIFEARITATRLQA